MTTNLFDLVFKLSEVIFLFASRFYDFFTKPLGSFITKVDWLTKVPLLGTFVSSAYNFILPFSFLDIMGSSALATILVLIIIKRIVPVA
jgi:hypothetical protein